MTAPARLEGIEACVFDAYGTLFDVHSAVGRHRARIGAAADSVSATWRSKQLQYTWLRSLMDRWTPFSEVTEDSLDFALDEAGIADDALRRDLLAAYRSLECYPEVKGVLDALRGGRMRTAILSNGSREMLDAAVASAGLGSRLDEVLSVDDAGIFKPHPDVYRLPCDRLGVRPEAVCFMSSNAWDAAGGGDVRVPRRLGEPLRPGARAAPRRPGRGGRDPRSTPRPRARLGRGVRGLSHRRGAARAGPHRT